MLVTERSSKYAILLIFAVAFVLRTLYVFTLEAPSPIRADASKYTAIAYNIVNYGIYSPRFDKEPNPDTWIAPGYPLFLTLFSGSLKNPTVEKPISLLPFYKTVLLSQALLSALSVLLLTTIAYRALGYWPGIVAGLAATFSPHLIVGAGYVLTETLFITLMLASLAVWTLADFSKHPLRNWAIMSVICAMAAMVRPVYALFPLALAAAAGWAWRYSARQLLASVAVVLIVTVLVWTPWGLYRMEHKGVEEVSAVAASFAFGQYPNLIYRTPKLRGFPYREDPEYNEMQKSLSKAISITLARATEEPWRYLKWYLIGKPIQFLSWSIVVGQGGPFIYPVNKSLFSPPSPGMYVLYVYKYAHGLLLLATLLVVGLSIRMLLKRESTPDRPLDAMILFSGVVTIYFLLAHTVLAPLPRYSIPLHSIYYLCFAWAVKTGLDLARRESNKEKHAGENE
jgi:4-amino-4-deoxy-L-arabinose transferase-like glycosyltransferase